MNNFPDMKYQVSMKARERTGDGFVRRGIRFAAATIADLHLKETSFLTDRRFLKSRKRSLLCKQHANEM